MTNTSFADALQLVKDQQSQDSALKAEFSMDTVMSLITVKILPYTKDGRTGYRFTSADGTVAGFISQKIQAEIADGSFSKAKLAKAKLYLTAFDGKYSFLISNGPSQKDEVLLPE